MAGNKKNTVLVADIKEDEVNLEARVTVRNLAGWELGFSKRHEVGDVTFAKNSTQRISRNEIQAQVNDGNTAFTGIDGRGSHATFYIEDELTRKWLGFETDEEEQKILTDKLVKDMFKLSQANYEKAIQENVVTRAEKNALIEAIKRLKLNDYSKIMYATAYTGYKMPEQN